MLTFQLEIITPNKTVYTGTVEHFRAPGTQGGFGVLAGHLPMLTSLEVGQILFKEQGGPFRRLTISGGFAEIQRGRVTVLAESAEFTEEIDVVRAQAARDRALERLHHAAGIDVIRAQAALARALNRLKAASAG